MVGRINMFWNNKVISKEFVELSIGKVYFYNLTKKIVDYVERKSIINETITSVPIYLQEMEKQLIVLQKRKIENLSISDMNKLRKKVRELLIENNLLNVEEDQLDDKDIEWFDTQKEKHVNMLKIGGNNGRRNN